jgi:hypothetical protein
MLIASGNNANPRVDTNDAHQTVVAWEATNDGPDTIDYVRFDEDTGWDSPSNVPTPFPNVYAPVKARVAMHSSGSAELGWRGAAPIGASESDEPATPHVAISPDGFGVAVWADAAGIWANRFE